MVIKVLTDKRLVKMEFHGCLHIFLNGRGTDTVTVYLKLTQQLAYMDQVPLYYGTFIDLKKAYDTMDRDRCMGILMCYRSGQRCANNSSGTVLNWCRSGVFLASLSRPAKVFNRAGQSFRRSSV